MTTTKEQPPALAQPPSRPFHIRVVHKIEDFIDDINWLHVAFKTCAFTYIAFMIWVTWQVLPVQGHWDVGRQFDRLPQHFQDVTNYFSSFDGFAGCRISTTDLYTVPPQNEHGNYASNTFCPNRNTLLQAMSHGGRIGFDAPYKPKDCHYRWYSVAEICMILERFDGIVFIGDDSLQAIYNGLNILLRQNLALGALQTWSMNNDAKVDCQCDNQFTKPDCARHFVTASDQVSQASKQHNAEISKGYFCERTPHILLKIDGGKPTQSSVVEFNRIVPKAPRSRYRPIPVVHALSPATASHRQASVSLLEFLKLADLSERKTPMLWIGPTAAGHIEIKGRKSNQEIWDFDARMAQTARENDIEVLKMWNMTVQATSWDGVRFGEKVALVQAMMVINWLGRLESS